MEGRRISAAEKRPGLIEDDKELETESQLEKRERGGFGESFKTERRMKREKRGERKRRNNRGHD